MISLTEVVRIVTLSLPARQLSSGFARTQMSPKTKTPEIALAFNVGVPYLHRIAQGIREYADAHRPDWRFMLSAEMFNLTPASLKGWRGAGVIAHCDTRQDEQVVHGLGCPAVNISGVLAASRLPQVRSDNHAIGCLAATTLLRRGFQRFGFYGIRGARYSADREAGFRETIDAAGGRCDVLRSDGSFSRRPRWDRHQDDIDGWLRTLETPCAVMGAHDPRAAMVIRACRRVGLHVPKDIAVIGSGNDPVICDWQNPALSSIDPDAHAIGRLAAETLDRLMAGKTVPVATLVTPTGVRERQSTNTHAFEQPHLAAAIRFIETEYRHQISIDQIATAAARSRRWLESAFRREMGLSPAAFLRRTRVRAIAAELRLDPTLRPSRLAALCGFTSNRQMFTAFEQETGDSFGTFRGTHSTSRNAPSGR
jgi:LacI family transcriptional regulator